MNELPGLCPEVHGIHTMKKITAPYALAGFSRMKIFLPFCGSGHTQNFLKEVPYDCIMGEDRPAGLRPYFHEGRNRF